MNPVRPVQILTCLFATTLGIHPAAADLEDDQVLVQLRNPTFDNVQSSIEVDVVPGDSDRVDFFSQNTISIDVDPDSVRLDLECDFSACRFSESSDFAGFAILELDWGDSGDLLDLEIETNMRFLGMNRVAIVPGGVAINLAGQFFRSGEFIRISPVFAPMAAIDIAPGSPLNLVRPGTRTSVVVALLGSAELDVLDADVFSLRFGPGQAVPSREVRNAVAYRLTIDDVDDDGTDDLLLRFEPDDTGLGPDDVEACLTGSIAGLPFVACDSVEVRE